MSRYRITESVGNRVETVEEVQDLEKHHPSSGREPGRDYETINGELEEVRYTLDGRSLVKKDFILSQESAGAVHIPAPVAGYIHYLNDATNAVRIYDRPFGEAGAKLLAQSLHMTRGTSPPEGSRIEYGQPIGRMGDTGSPGSVHAHMEVEPLQFQRYISDVHNGAIAPDRYPSPGTLGESTRVGDAMPMADGVLRQGEAGAEVARLQQQLNERNYGDAQGRVLATDGDFGPSTRQALESLQRARGLEVDGVAGKDTFAVLNTARQPDPPHPAADDPAPSVPRTPPVNAGAYGPTALSNLIGSGEGDYNSSNRGRAGDSGNARLDLTGMTVGEIMRRQDLPRNDPDRLFAVGKFQIIPGTMEETVRAMGIDRNQRYTPELQERMFADYLVDEKRPAVNAYITGSSSGPDALGRAQLALAQEFASVADPRTGKSFYDGDSAGNSASIGADQAATALNQMRRQYQDNIGRGLSPDAAYRGLGGEAPTLVPGGSAPSDGNRALSVGDQGVEVEKLQNQLNQLGFRDAQARALATDGDFGTRSLQAVRGFQRAQRLEVDGVVGRDTSAALRQASQQAPQQTGDATPGLLLQGSQGPAVRKLQEQLNRLGSGDGRAMAVDGYFGPITAASVKEFQRRHGLAVDGVAGPRTQQALHDAIQHPVLSNPSHPDHAMYRQALDNLGKLDPQRTGFQTSQQIQNAAGSLVFDARVSGITRIDHVVLSGNGQGLFAIQGRLDDPAQLRVHVDKAQAATQPLAQSTAQLAHGIPAHTQVQDVEQSQRRVKA